MGFWEWIEGDPNQKRDLKSSANVILTVFVIDWVWQLVVCWFMLVPPPQKKFLWWETLVFAPLAEEICFRLIPVWSIMILAVNRRALFLWVGLITSASFGLLHGSFLNMFFQGVSGLFLWMIFLYCSRAGKDLIAGYAGSVALHFLYNLSIFIIKNLL